MVKPVWLQEEMRISLERKKVIMLTGPREESLHRAGPWGGGRGGGRGECWSGDKGAREWSRPKPSLGFPRKGGAGQGQQ